MGPVGVAAARDAFASGDWRTAHDLFELAQLREALDTDDLDLLGRSCWWLGDTAGFLEVGEEVYRARVATGDQLGAASRALELCLAWTTEGDVVIGQAWLNRARRILRDLPPSPVHGYLVYLDAGLAYDFQDDPAPAAEAARVLPEMARAFDDPALEALGLVIGGMAQVWGGRTAEGFGDLDEALLPVIARVVPPQWSGDVYCSVIHLCLQLGDLARMRAWTDALQHWAAPLSETFMYAGITRVHQLQLLSAEGEWDVVEHEVAGRSRELVGSHGWVAAEGYRELGDVRRLRGDVVGARSAYDRTRDLGVTPQPGEALLDEADGRGGEALTGLLAALAEEGRIGRARLLLPVVEVALRAGDIAQAEASGAELEETAALHDTPGLRAWSDHATACLLLHRGAWDAALAHLDAAAAVYRSQRCRHATARVPELVARVHEGRGDPASAAAEVATALAIYRRLGAGPDAARLEPHRPPGGLTGREEEVLRCVLGGASNREVAEHLVISEKTVSRHLANIYTKAGVSSRTAAAAWAREHGIEPVRTASVTAPNTP